MASGCFEEIYGVVRAIPYGRVATYGQIARMVGNPRLSRVVGCAMYSAPEDLPCHRVVNRFGGLCPCFGPTGADGQRLLLQLEGVEFTPEGNVDLERFQWRP